MMLQGNISGARDGQTEAEYGRYIGEQEYVPRHEDTFYPPLPRESLGEKVSSPIRDNTNMYRLLVFVISMATLLAFVYVCLVVVGGTGGWISFCAASLAILTIASTFISAKREGEK